MGVVTYTVVLTVPVTATTGTYAVEPAQTTIVFSDIPYEDLARGTAREGRFLHIELLWRPDPGKTPVEPSATNLTIRLVVVSAGEVGVYAGGGFAWVTGGEASDHAIGLTITPLLARIGHDVARRLEMALGEDRVDPTEDHAEAAAVVIGFGSIPYPAVSLGDARLEDVIVKAAAGHGLSTLRYFPGISDMSFLGEASLKHFDTVKQLLSSSGVPWSVNPRAVRGLDYYSHTVFEFVTDELGAQGTLCGGGRYDGLFEVLGGKPTRTLIVNGQ
jgi:hypothetical protein